MATMSTLLMSLYGDRPGVRFNRRIYLGMDLLTFIDGAL